MTTPRLIRSAPGRRRRRRIRIRLLIALAVVASASLMAGLSALAVESALSCQSNPVYINVAPSLDIAPAIQVIAQQFNQDRHQADGRCVYVQVNPTSPAAAAAQIERPATPGQPQIDAWIPDSSLWIYEVRMNATGASVIQPTGFYVARSPLLMVMPAGAAAHTSAFGKAGWRLLLPQAAGGPPVPSRLQIDLPDPTQNATGLASVIEVARLLGASTRAKVNLTNFAYKSVITPSFDDLASLSSFVTLADPPLDSYPVTVASEQAVLQYDQANPHDPLAASYPTGPTASLGSPELDYPYVITVSNNRLHQDAALAFEQDLQSSYATSVLRFDGFRTGSGVPAAFPGYAAALRRQLLQIAPPAGPGEAPAALQAWQKLETQPRDLAVFDVSQSMATPVAPGSTETLEALLTKTSALGLGLFPDNSLLGLWEFADHLNGSQPYRQLVPIGPLSANMGVLTRRQILQRFAGTLQPNGGAQVRLYGTILDAFKTMQASYQPKFVNSVLVLTAGLENAPGDVSASQLIATLSRLYNPNRPVHIIIIVTGRPPNFGDLMKISQVTGGQTFPITNPSEVGKVFYEAIAHRLCLQNSSCSG